MRPAARDPRGRVQTDPPSMQVPALIREAGHLAGAVRAGSGLVSAGPGDEAAIPSPASPACTAPAAAGAGGPSGLRAAVLALTLGPPLALAAAVPDSFLGFLTFAGAYLMTILYGCLPPLMAWRMRAAREASHHAAASHSGVTNRPAPAPFEPLVPGGQPVLAGLLAVVAALQLGRLAEDAVSLPGLGGNAAGALSRLVETAAGAAATLLPAWLAAPPSL